MVAASVLAISCRPPTDDEEPADTSTFGEFDASVGDGGARPEARCQADAGGFTFDSNHSPFYGGEEAVLVEVVYYSWLYCGHCAEFSEVARDLWKARNDFQKSVRLYYHHYSTSPRHAAAVAAQNQGDEHFWALTDFIYARMREDGTEVPTDEEIHAHADEVLGLDMERFDADLVAQETLDFLNWDKEQGVAAGMVGAPTVFICGERIPPQEFTSERLEALIDKYLKK
jgi:protein-disulfide isomerase